MKSILIVSCLKTLLNQLITARQRSYGKVMLSVASVRLSVILSTNGVPYVTAEVSSLKRLTNDAFRFKTPVLGRNV